MAKWWEAIKDGIADSATLDVVTTSGTIKLDPQTGDGERDFEELFNQIAGKVKAADSDIKLIAYTHAEWDCDTVNFVTEEPSEAELKLIQSHNAVVDAAHEKRRAAVQMLAEMIGVN
jgi:hypothetical protein